jgi:hypothetical protein
MTRHKQTTTGSSSIDPGIGGNITGWPLLSSLPQHWLLLVMANLLHDTRDRLALPAH